MSSVWGCGPSERISALGMGAAIVKMKQGKSVGPMGVVAEDAQGCRRNWYIADD